ncbi:ATP-binding protein involved in chromosome partitioning [Bacillus ectoiniformans]|uniref:Mrp/NBP35 family ATP-binding protein n=1 Tax=Bacillus ectoiniformans TaxID=1494429 RepID=UPI00195F0561|nr:Mrp/NBP35 family ATP-binding protein [Bacillus ectoiniformans]MBM7648613.1 ATP-binding protein involved in chromosome partitioning [Bacillus ectoiniformans]
MLTKEKVLKLAGMIQDPILHKSVQVKEVKIKENYVGLKVGLSKTGTPQQLEIQQKLVDLLKEAGAESVGLRFEQLTLEELTPDEAKKVNPGVPPLLSPNSKTAFISIASGKGGVGKSTVSSNLAVALSRLGKKVGLIDADIYGFSIPNMMGIERRPEIVNDKIIPPERFGVKVMSMAFFSEDNSPVLWRGPMLGKMLNSFFTEVNWGELDYLLLDLPPGTGDIALDVHSKLPTSKEIIVTTPHPTAAHVAVRAGKMALKTNHEILGVIENMSYFQSEETGKPEYVFGRGGGETLKNELATDLFGQLPLAQPDENSADSSRSIYGADHPVGKVYESIASRVAAKVEMEQFADAVLEGMK